MKKLLKILPALGLALMLSAFPVLAAEDETGQIVINIYENGEEDKPVSGGLVNLVKVADYNPGDGTITLVPEMAASQIELAVDSSGGFSASLASQLADFNSDRKLLGKTIKTNSDGRATFQNLEPGIYLCTDRKAADGYEKISPFLIAMPSINEDGVSSWDLSVHGKAKPVDKSENPTPAPIPTTPGTSHPGTSSSGSGSGTPSSASKPSTAGSSNTSVQTYGTFWLILFGFGLAGFAIIKKFRKTVQ